MAAILIACLVLRFLLCKSEFRSDDVPTFETINFQWFDAKVHPNETLRNGSIQDFGITKNELSSKKLITFTAFNKSFRVKVLVGGNAPKILKRKAVKYLSRNNTSNMPLGFLEKNYFTGRVINRFGCQVTGFLRKPIIKGIITCYDEDEVYYIEPTFQESTTIESASFFSTRIFKQRHVGCANDSTGDPSWCSLKSNEGIKGPKVIRPISQVYNEPIIPTNAKNLHCSLHLIADHTFYKSHFKNKGVTVYEMTSIINEVDKIFRGTDFNGDNKADNIGFRITKVSVFGDEYPMLKDNIPSSQVLEQLSVYAASVQKKFCLTVLFTSRDFKPNHTTSLAYHAQPNHLGHTGGICESNIVRTNFGRARMNTLFVTNINNNRVTPRSAMPITLAHALGHAFGSGHEINNCNSATSDHFAYYSLKDSTLDTHRRFSIWSIKHMLPVIRNKGSCLVKEKNPIVQKQGYWTEQDHRPVCGDGIIDASEECDCGNYEDCSFLDPCCIPPTQPNGTKNKVKECTVNRLLGFQCSPLTSPCCDESCKIEKRTNIPCSGFNDECVFFTTCDGKNAKCPTAKVKLNGVPCAGTSKVCIDGKCTGTICTINKMEDCECAVPDESLCDVCCKDPKDGLCISASVKGFFSEGRKYKLLPGASCNNGTGYCNSNGYCKPLDEYPKDALKGGDKLHRNIFKHIIANYWYYVLLLLVFGFLLFRVIFGYVSLSRNAQNMNVLKAGVLMGKERICKVARSIRAPSKVMDQSYRLAFLFPNAPASDIIQVAQENRNEKDQVKFLLENGYPMRINFLPNDTNLQQEESRVLAPKNTVKLR